MYVYCIYTAAISCIHKTSWWSVLLVEGTRVPGENYRTWGLIHNMNSYGKKGPLIEWFENYLYQRKQKVINRATSSTVCEVSAGVPQGSVLERLLFLIYINDIGEKLLSSQ